MYKLLILFLINLQLIPVLAQGNDEPKDSLFYMFESVTVTATRYNENVMEIPYAVSLIPKKDFEGLKGYGLDEVLNRIPGVLAQTRAGTHDVRLVIRGFGARGAGDRSNSGTSRGIKILLDGIPETEPDGRTAFDHIDLSLAEEIEVVRSNSSAVWGNASGGIVNITTIPNNKKPYYSFLSTFGSFGLRKYAFRNLTAFDNGKLSISFIRTDFDGYRNHSAATRSLFSAGMQSFIGERSLLGVYMVGSSNLFHIPGPLTMEQFLSDQKQANSTYEARDERRYNRTGRIGVTLDHEYNDIHSLSAMIFVNPKYLQRSERGTFRDFTRYHFGGNLVYKSKFKISDETENRLVVGMDEAYQDGAVIFYSLSPTNYRGSTLRDNKREGANTFGAFLQNEVIINEKISVIAGLRYDNITYYSEDFLDPSFGLQKKSYEKLTPKAGISYRYSPSTSFYANIGGGLEVPAGNETDPAPTFGQDSVFLLNPLLEPIQSNTIEGGVKQYVMFNNNSFLNYIMYEATLYYISIKNDIIPYANGRYYFTAGKSSRTGVELSFFSDFTQGLSLQLTYTYLDAQYDDYTIDSVHYGKPGKSASFDGNKAAGIPNSVFFGSVTYEPEQIQFLKLGVSASSVAGYFVDDANTIEVPSYTIFNASISTGKGIPLGGKVTLNAGLSVNNITNESYVASAFINPDKVGGVPVYIEPGLPANYVFNIGLRF